MNTINTPFYDYNFKKPITKRIESNRKDRTLELSYYNPVSNKWGTQKPKPAPIKKWIDNGSRIKYLYVPKKLSDKRIDRTRKINNLYNLIEIEVKESDIKTVLHILFTRSFYSDKSGYSPIYCRKFSDLIGQKYSSVLEYCKRFHWIDSNEFFKFNNEESVCKSYKISNRLLPNNDSFKFRKTALDNVKTTNRFQTKEQTFTEHLELKETHRILAEIARMAKVDLEGFKSEVDSNPELFKHRKLDLAFYLIEEINTGNISIKETVDTFGERFFSGFCNIIKETRKHIYFNDKMNKLKEVDFSNSQMYFFQLLSDKKFFKEVLLDNTYNSTDEAKFNHLFDELQLIKNKPDFKQFCTDATNGTVYDTIAKGSKSWGRDRAKEMMMKVLFAKRGQFKASKREINKTYPSVINIIEKVAYGVNETTISMACQRVESTMLLDIICQKLFHQHKIKQFITVHDSIMAEERHVPVIKGCIDSVFQELGVNPPNLK